MARESELTGIVKPDVDRRSLERNVERPMSRAFDRVSNITPNLNLRGMGRRLTRMMPGSGMLRRGRGAMSGSAGGDGGDVQQAQLSKLDDIHEEIRKGNVSRAGQLPGGGGGGGTSIIPMGGAAGLLSGVGLGSLGLGATAAGGGLALGGLLGGKEALGNVNVFENLETLLSGGREAEVPTLEEGLGTAIAGLGGPIGGLFADEITEALEGLDLPDLGSMEWPELPSLESLDWPDLPELPDLSSMQWPELPDLSQDVQWPGLPSEVSNLESQVNWPQPPGWVQQLIDALESFGGGDGGGSQFAGEDSHMGPSDGIDVGPIRVDLPGIDEQSIERKIRRVLQDEFSGLGDFP